MNGSNRPGGERTAADDIPASPSGMNPRRVIDVIEELYRWTDTTASHRMPSGHEPLDPLAQIGQDDVLRARVVRDLLLGEATGIQRRLEAELLGIDLGRPYVAFRARARRGRTPDDLAVELAAQCAPGSPALTARLDGDVIGLFLEPPVVVATGVVGVGPAAPPDELVDSFHLASRAVDAMLAFGLAGVRTFDDLGLLPIILSDADVGKVLWQRYVLAVDDGDPRSELTRTVRCWFACGMHVDRAAALLALHPNTVRNRIARFEHLADVDLVDASAAMQVWWALQYGALVEHRPVTVAPRRAS